LFVFCRHNPHTGEAKRDRGQVITFDYLSSVSLDPFSVGDLYDNFAALVRRAFEQLMPEHRRE
jgi:hypothetical protein